AHVPDQVKNSEVANIAKDDIEAQFALSIDPSLEIGFYCRDI
ncbi:hypothetical protein SOVF_000570, partial [Spinacia oleracea]